MWSDPKKNSEQDWTPSGRGVSYTFSEKVVHEFCRCLKIDLIVRAHQGKDFKPFSIINVIVSVVLDGYEFFADRKMLTIFSAPNVSLYINV